MGQLEHKLDVMHLAPYIKIARLDHWFKQFFCLPGFVFGIALYGHFSWSELVRFSFAILLTCFIASANYVINEWLDAPYDKFHPTKKNRPSVAGEIKFRGVLLEYIIFAAPTLIISWIYFPYTFSIILTFLLFMGIVYNVKPLRTKDLPYLDVLTESINNPIRFLLGWLCLVPTLPASSILFSYWFGGAFLMAVKRYAEYRYINDSRAAGLYRSSFRHYNEIKLTIFAWICANLSSLFLGVFLIKYRPEFFLAFPFIAVLFGWYYYLGACENSVVMNPEKLYREKLFMCYIIYLSLLFITLIMVDIPILTFLTKTLSFE